MVDRFLVGIGGEDDLHVDPLAATGRLDDGVPEAGLPIALVPLLALTDVAVVGEVLRVVLGLAVRRCVAEQRGRVGGLVAEDEHGRARR